MDWYECEKRYWARLNSMIENELQVRCSRKFRSACDHIYQLIRVGQRIFDINSGFPGSTISASPVYPPGRGPEKLA
jgi:hypothetical protein